MKSIHPYELLIRWDRDGAIAGAHVQWREVFTEGEEAIAERLGDAQPVDIGIEGGFPASEIVGKALADALSTLAIREARIAELEADTGHEQPSLGGPAPRSISKDAIWRRATDEEAEAMEDALQGQPIRLRRIYEGATHIKSDDELFGLLSATMTTLFGADRAAELLAPST